MSERTIYTVMPRFKSMQIYEPLQIRPNFNLRTNLFRTYELILNIYELFLDNSILRTSKTKNVTSLYYRQIKNLNFKKCFITNIR